MYDPGEDELRQTTGTSTETESTDMVPGDSASMDFLAENLNAKKPVLLEEGDIEAPDADHDVKYQDPMMRICRYCGREFKSDKALGGHLRIHSQHDPKSRAGNSHPVKSKRARKHPPKEDDGFACFGCPESFSSMKLLCQHVRDNHRQNGSKPNASIQQRPSPPQETHSLSEPDQTTVEEEEVINEVVFPGCNNYQNQDSCKGLLKQMSNWSATGKRNQKRTASYKIDVDNIIYDAVPLRAYYEFTGPGDQTETRHEDSEESNQIDSLTRKKQKTEEIMSNQDHSAPTETESQAADSLASLISHIGSHHNSNQNQTTTCKMPTMPQKLDSHPVYKVKFVSSKGRLKDPNQSKMAKKSVHQCEICGKTYETGQALGGHKSYHRVKPEVDPFRGMLVQRKATEQTSRETGHGFSEILSPGALSEKADEIEESYEEHPKRLLDFDLNIPYEG